MCFFSHTDFNAQEINQFDSNGKRTGVWRKFHPNKKIRYEGKFLNGKEVGDFKFYDASGSRNPTIIRTYTKNSNEVSVSYYTLKGLLQSKGTFVDKKRVGKWKYFFPEGNIMSEENYIDGELNGFLINYYPSGQTTEISTYKSGLKNGASSKYSSDGILIEVITYENGKPNGIAKYFELNGDLKEIGFYKDGKRAGEWKYYLDGEISQDSNANKKKTFTKKNKE
jgi:antitoxin component YwqK of YwqJK toxin-antitoxin module